jgi:hypothetical protein
MSLPCRDTGSFNLHESVRPRKKNSETPHITSIELVYTPGQASYEVAIENYILGALTFSHYEVNADEDEGVFHGDILYS